MHSNCNHGSANGLSAHARDLLGFAAIVRLNNLGFEPHKPSLTADGRAVTVAGWAIAMDRSGPPARHFGLYANCSPIARCIGCEQICPTEDPAVDLSVASEGRSALWIEARSANGKVGDVTVRTFVPGRPDLSGVWYPTLCTRTQQLELVAVDGTRKARLCANGHLMTSTLQLGTGVPAMATTMFFRKWASLAAAYAPDGRANPWPAHLPAGAI